MQRFQAGDQVLKEEWLLSTHARKSQLISVYVHWHGIYMYVLNCENSHCLNGSNNPQTGLLSGLNDSHFHTATPHLFMWIQLPRGLWLHTSSSYFNFFILKNSGMVDPLVAEGGVCLMDWVSPCRPLFPRVWCVDTVCEHWACQCLETGCITKQVFTFCLPLSTVTHNQLVRL